MLNMEKEEKVHLPFFVSHCVCLVLSQIRLEILVGNRISVDGRVNVLNGEDCDK